MYNSCTCTKSIYDYRIHICIRHQIFVHTINFILVVSRERRKTKKESTYSASLCAAYIKPQFKKKGGGEANGDESCPFEARLKILS